MDEARLAPPGQETNTSAQQYDKLAGEYQKVTEQDPIKTKLQYPSALRLVGDVTGQEILDVGCGNGVFELMLAKQDVRIVGYDSSPEQIKKANDSLDEDLKEKVSYLAAEPADINKVSELAGKQFDKAVALLVLFYSPDKEYLKTFFDSTCKLLKPGGTFSSIVINPDFHHFNEPICRRRISQLPDNKMQVEFLDQDNQPITSPAVFTNFTKEDYESAALAGGFTESRWEALVPPVPQSDMEAAFWQEYESDPLYLAFITSKQAED